MRLGVPDVVSEDCLSASEFRSNRERLSACGRSEMGSPCRAWLRSTKIIKNSNGN